MVNRPLPRFRRTAPAPRQLHPPDLFVHYRPPPIKSGIVASRVMRPESLVIPSLLPRGKMPGSTPSNKFLGSVEFLLFSLLMVRTTSKRPIPGKFTGPIRLALTVQTRLAKAASANLERAGIACLELGSSEDWRRQCCRCCAMGRLDQNNMALYMSICRVGNGALRTAPMLLTIPSRSGHLMTSPQRY